MLEALRTVDEVIVYQDVDKIVKEVDFDVFAIGEDQTHNGFITAADWCIKNKKEIVRLKRTEGISSSNIKQNIGK